jgi:hypothetical protein
MHRGSGVRNLPSSIFDKQFGRYRGQHTVCRISGTSGQTERRPDGQWKRPAVKAMGTSGWIRLQVLPLYFKRPADAEEVCRALGVTAVLPKPLNPTRLLTALAGCCRKNG